MVSSSNIWAEVSAGLDHSLFLNSFGFLFSSGNNTNGQLGNGSNTASNMMLPATNTGAQFRYIAISAGGGHSLAIDNGNQLWSSGLNMQGQLGLGNNTSTNALIQVGTSNTWFAISAGDVHSLAMETTTSLWSTGRGLEGQLGIGTNVANNTLQSVGCPTTVLANETVSIDKNTISVYPNPTNTIVNIDYTLENSSNVVLRVTNIQGQVITEIKTEKSSGLNTDTLDLSSQSSGMYFLTLTSGNNTYTTKIVKQ
jgi:alpha-tubulin suppressor-like RCC1 family protein